MERLLLRMTRVPYRLPLSAAVIASGVAVYLIRLIFQHTTVTGMGRQVMVLLFGVYLLVLALGSFLPEDGGGFTLRSAARWLTIPMLAGGALFFVEVYQVAGMEAVFGQASRMMVGLILAWFIGRYDEPR